MIKNTGLPTPIHDIIRHPNLRAISPCESIIPNTRLSALDGDLRKLVDVLLGQAQDVVIEAPARLVVADAVLEEDAAVQHGAEGRPVAREEPLLGVGVALRGLLVLYGPVRARRARDAQYRLEHRLLVHAERRHVHELVLVPRQARPALRLGL